MSPLTDEEVAYFDEHGFTRSVAMVGGWCLTTKSGGTWYVIPKPNGWGIWKWTDTLLIEPRVVFPSAIAAAVFVITEVANG